MNGQRCPCNSNHMFANMFFGITGTYVCCLCKAGVACCLAGTPTPLASARSWPDSWKVVR